MILIMMRKKELNEGLIEDGWIFSCQKMREKKYNQFLLSNAFNAKQFGIKHYEWKLVMVRNFSCLNFWDKIP